MFDFDTVIDRRHTGSLKFDRYADRDVLPMWVADMDFRSPEPVIEALKARADHGVFGYSEASESQTAAVVDMLQAKYDWTVAGDQLVWSPGVVPMLNVAGRMIRPNQRVLITTPIYPPFLSMPKVADRAHDTVEMVWDSSHGHWTFDFDALEGAVTPDTALFMLCSPYNPLGRAFNRDELTRIADFCIRHDLILVSDEIHCELILDDIAHIPTATLGDEIAKRTIAMYAPSKTYNLPGLGCAFAVISDDRLRARFKAAARGNISEVTAMGYAGCEAAYRHGEPWRLALLDYLRGNRDRVQQFVADELPGISTTHVQATYLQWLDVSELNAPDLWEHCMSHGICLSPSRPFGDLNHLRLNFGTPRVTLDRGLDLLKTAIDAL